MIAKFVIFAAVCAAWGVCAVQSNLLDMAEHAEGRSKRETTTPKHWQEKYSCCSGVPLLIKNESKVDCFPSWSSTPPAGDYPCWAECSFKKQLLVTPGNQLNMSSVGVRVAEMVKDAPSWAPLLNAAYTKCKALTPTIPASQQCKSGAAEFKHCFNGHLFSNCPAALRNPSAKCDDVLARAGQPRSG